MTHPKLYKLSTINSNAIITIAENKNIPFEVKRVFWITSIKKGAVRGEHAHKTSEQLLVCIQGALNVTLESVNGKKEFFQLSKPNEAVYIPPNFWGRIEYVSDSTVLALASDEYNEDDYIRDYAFFKAQQF